MNNVIKREISLKRNTIIENKVFYEQVNNDIYSTVCIEIGNDINSCNNCTQDLNDWKEKNKSFQSTYPIIKDTYKLIQCSIAKIVNRCKNRCKIGLINYTIHIGKTNLDRINDNEDENVLLSSRSISEKNMGSMGNFYNKSETEDLSLLLIEKEKENKKLILKYENLLKLISELKLDFKQNVIELNNSREKNFSLENQIDNLKLENKRKFEEINKTKIENESIVKFNYMLRAKLQNFEEKIQKLENEKNILKSEKIEGKLDKLQGDVITQINKNKLKSYQDTIDSYMKKEILKEKEIQYLKEEKQAILKHVKIISPDSKFMNSDNTITSISTGKSRNSVHSSKNIERLKSCFNFSSCSLPDIVEDQQKIENIKNEYTINNNSSVFCMTSFKVDGNIYIATGGVDTSIKIYNLTQTENEKDRLVATLYGHKGIVWSMCTMKLYDKDIIVSGSIDSTIKIWDPFPDDTSSNHLIDTLCGSNGHQGIIFCLTTVTTENSESLIISGGFDKTIKIWNPFGQSLQSNQYTQSQLIATLKAHSHYITCITTIIESGNQYIISGSSDQTIKVWSLFDIIQNAQNKSSDAIEAENEPISTFKPFEHSYTECITTCTFNKKHFIAIGGGNYVIKIIDIFNKSAPSTIVSLSGHSDSIISILTMYMDNQIVIVSGSLDKTIKIWNPINEELMITLHEHSDSISSLMLLNLNEQQTTLVSGSWDKSIRIWN